MHVFNRARAIQVVFRAEITLADAWRSFIWLGPSSNYFYGEAVKAGRYFEPTLLNQTLDSWGFGISQLGTGARMVTPAGTFYLHRQGIESHYVREHKKGNPSLTALAVLLPFLDLLDDRDVEYIMSSQGRYEWYQNLPKRSIRVKGGLVGSSGESVNMWTETTALLPPQTLRDAPAFVKSQVRRVIRRLIR